MLYAAGSGALVRLGSCACGIKPGTCDGTAWACPDSELTGVRLLRMSPLLLALLTQSLHALETTEKHFPLCFVLVLFKFIALVHCCATETTEAHASKDMSLPMSNAAQQKPIAWTALSGVQSARGR